MPAKTAEPKVKVKARPVNIGQLIMVTAFEKNFSTGSTGFFGQAMAADGTKYTVTAIKNGSKPKVTKAS